MIRGNGDESAGSREGSGTGGQGTGRFRPASLLPDPSLLPAAPSLLTRLHPSISNPPESFFGAMAGAANVFSSQARISSRT